MDMSINSTPNMFQPTLHNHYRKKSSLNYRKTVHTHSIKFVKIFFLNGCDEKKRRNFSKDFFSFLLYNKIYISPFIFRSVTVKHSMIACTCKLCIIKFHRYLGYVD